MHTLVFSLIFWTASRTGKSPLTILGIFWAVVLTVIVTATAVNHQY
jgi:hypothetical protein